jgi:NAD(P)-dependent dehydrogenase (short-subunit alcohol dehydrogenase family)
MEKGGGVKDFKAKTAVVTGAASGIGAGIATTLAGAGMNVALVDIQERALQQVHGQITAAGGKAIAIRADVSDARSLAAAAQAAEQAYGRIHVAVNNAGVAMHGTPLEEMALEDWNWVIGVNLYGVIHGIRTFVPLIRKHGEGGHVVNTASIGGLQMRPGWNTGAYSMTKYAVVALSEALEQELQGSGIGVSVLCPAAVRTSIYDSAKNRPARLGGPFERKQHRFLKDTIADGLAPVEVGERVLRAIRDDEFFVFTHSEPRQVIEARHRRILDAFDRIAAIEKEAHANQKH